jgi:hypothetical protein
MSNDKLLSDLGTLMVVRDNLDLLYRSIAAIAREIGVYNCQAQERLCNAANYVAYAVGEVFAANCTLREAVNIEVKVSEGKQ